MRDVTVSRTSNRYLTQKSDNYERSETGDGRWWNFLLFSFIWKKNIYLLIDALKMVKRSKDWHFWSTLTINDKRKFPCSCSVNDNQSAKVTFLVICAHLCIYNIQCIYYVSTIYSIYILVPDNLAVLAPVDDGPTVQAAHHAQNVRLVQGGDNALKV